MLLNRNPKRRVPEYMWQNSDTTNKWVFLNLHFTDQGITQKWDPIDLSFEGLQLQKWNILTDRVQRTDEKNGIVCPVLFPPRVMVIKILKMAHCFVFYAYDSKTLITVWAKCLNAPDRSYWVLSENGMFNRFWSYHVWNTEGRITKNSESAKNTEILYSQELTSC